MRRPPGLWILLSAGVLWLSLQDVYGIRATALIFGKSTTTTTTTEIPEKAENAEEDVITETNAETSNITGPTLTGNPQIDYQFDPNLPKELNGYNLSDYPFYERVPDEEFDFKCDGLHDGFYASVAHKCQVYHHCLFGTRYDFLCANYTAFDQKTFICHFASEVDCENSKKYWHRNDALYQAQSTTTQKPINIYTTESPAHPQTPSPFNTPGGLNRRPGAPGGGSRRRPPSRRRRPQYDYYEDEYYEDDYYVERPRAQNRRRKRPSRPRPVYEEDYEEYDEDEERFERPRMRRKRPEVSRRKNKDRKRYEYEDEEDDNKRTTSEQSGTNKRNKKPQKTLEEEDYEDGNNKRPTSEQSGTNKRNKKPQKTLEEEDYEDSNNKRQSSESSGTNKRNKKPQQTLEEEDYEDSNNKRQSSESSGTNKRNKKPQKTSEEEDYEDSNNKRQSSESSGTNKRLKKPQKTSEEEDYEDSNSRQTSDNSGTNSRRRRPFSTRTQDDYDEEPKPLRKRRPNSGTNYDQDSFERPSKNRKTTTTESTRTIIKPVSGTIYDRPRLAPKIKLPVPKNEAEKYAYKPISTSTMVPNDEEYYDDEDYEEEPIVKEPKRKVPEENNRKYSSTRVRAQSTKKQEILEEPISVSTTTKRPKFANRFSGTNSGTNSRKRPPIVEQSDTEQEPIEKPKPVFKTKIPSTTSTTSSTTPSTTTVQAQEPIVRIVKRPFLPSRGGNPYSARGLQPVGTKAVPEVVPDVVQTVQTVQTGQVHDSLENVKTVDKSVPFKPSPAILKVPVSVQTSVPISVPNRPKYHLEDEFRQYQQQQTIQRTTQKPKISQNPLDLNEYDVTLNDALNPTLPNLPIRGYPSGFSPANDYTFSSFQRNRFAVDPSVSASNSDYSVQYKPARLTRFEGPVVLQDSRTRNGQNQQYYTTY